MAVAHGKARNSLCVTDFPRVKLPSGNFHGCVKKNKRISHDSSRGTFRGLIGTQSGSTMQPWESEMYQTLKITCCVHRKVKSYPSLYFKLDSNQNMAHSFHQWSRTLSFRGRWNQFCSRVNTQVRPWWRTTSWGVLKYKTKNCKLWKKCICCRRRRSLLAWNKFTLNY